jgi:hypothetical protein
MRFIFVALGLCLSGIKEPSDPDQSCTPPSRSNMLAIDTSRPAHLLSPLLSEPLNESITPPAPSYFILPDLVAYLAVLPLSGQPNADAIAAESTRWLVDGCVDLSPRRRAALQSLKVMRPLIVLLPISIHFYRPGNYVRYATHMRPMIGFELSAISSDSCSISTTFRTG